MKTPKEIKENTWESHLSIDKENDWIENNHKEVGMDSSDYIPLLWMVWIALFVGWVMYIISFINLLLSD